jgi:hypothetical protein
MQWDVAPTVTITTTITTTIKPSIVTQHHSHTSIYPSNVPEDLDKVIDTASNRHAHEPEDEPFQAQKYHMITAVPGVIVVLLLLAVLAAISFGCYKSTRFQRWKKTRAEEREAGTEAIRRQKGWFRLWR